MQKSLSIARSTYIETSKAKKIMMGIVFNNNWRYNRFQIYQQT